MISRLIFSLLNCHWSATHAPLCTVALCFFRSHSVVVHADRVTAESAVVLWYPSVGKAAAAAAKSLQSCPTVCDPIDGSPPGSPIPGILQARTLEWVAISFSSAWRWKVKVKSLSCVRLLATSWTAAYQAPPSMGFSRQEYWSGVPLPSPVGKAGWIQISLLYLSSFSTQCSLKLRNKFGTAKKFTWLKSSYSNFFPPLRASSIKNTIILSFLLSFSWKNSSYLFFLIVIQQANLLTIALHYNYKNWSIVFVEIEFSLIDKCAMRHACVTGIFFL